MNVLLSPKADKYLRGLDALVSDRMKATLRKLAEEPPQGDIKALQGQDGYRLRVGKYRLLFVIDDGKIIVHDIGPRGQIYK